MHRTKQKPISDWLVRESAVFLLFRDGYRISYNPSTIYTMNHKKMRDPDFNFPEDIDSEETALYIQNRDCYLILDGDFREEFEDCTTIKQCLAVYKSYAPQYRSKWSMD